MSPGPAGGAVPGPDEEWARIVAELEDVRRAGDRHLAAPGERPPEAGGPRGTVGTEESRSTEESGSTEDARGTGDPGETRTAGPPEDRRAAEAEAPAEEDRAPAEEDDAAYSPDPGPVTQGLSPGALLAWTVLVGAPVLLVVLALLPGSMPWWATVTGLAAVVAAIGHLLHSLPEERDDFDDGARV